MNEIIYQLSLRTLTPDGTLNSAARLLPHIKSLGVTVVYLCPFFVADDEEDKSAWSPRQLESKTGNPKNPYKIKDYFNVDTEYGTNDDLKAFTEQAHALGLKVMFDLVYLHCGKNAVFIKDAPDFIERDADGSAVVGELWPFARLNFKNRELRRYLISNMEYLIREFGADGFRCDVGGRIPLDFWKEAFDHVKRLKPDLLTLNEGRNADAIDGVFDLNYGLHWRTTLTDIFKGEAELTALKDNYFKELSAYGKNIHKNIRAIDNHDSASDIGLDRHELTITPRGVEAALVITATYIGTPFLWNGYEVASASENNMFSNRFYGRRNYIDWSNGFTEDGQRRLEFIKDLYTLRKSEAALSDGSLEWHDTNDVIEYRRVYKNDVIHVMVNPSKEPRQCEFPCGRVLMSRGVKQELLDSFGYIIIKSDLN